ncbi:MAG TPA: DUF2892 domain-containing protein [Bacteroidota bacterium]|nr:DUF2892 domain-containing protein [Bacteroidota bacterium]
MAGRITRIIAGSAFIVWGCTHLEQTSASVFIILGIVPLAAGSLDWCLISPLLGGPMAGRKVRAIPE